MDEHNKFLEGYKKKNVLSDGQESQSGANEPPKEPLPAKKTEGGSKPVNREQQGLSYEQKTDFVKPVKKEFAPLPPPPKRPKWLIPVIIGASLLIILAVILIITLTGGITVEDFTGWTESNAQLWASQKGVVLQKEEVYNDAYEAGKVIGQSVAAGEKVNKGDLIKLTVSLGHDLTVRLPLPDIMNMTQQQVEKWAADNFMAKVRITAEYSETVPQGKVIRFEINDNTVVDEVTRNTPIYVIVSKGKEDTAAIAITVPNFKEKTLAESYIWANENGITLTVEEQFDDYVPKGSVISQSVKADEKIKKGDPVKLIVSKGKLVEVPDFSGYSKEKAMAVASGMGINVVVTEKYSGSAAGRFISQSISAGSDYEEGMVVELKYSLGNKVSLASYVSQTQDAIESWAKDLNDKGASITIKVTKTKSNAAKGSIIYQEPANKMISVNATINITVSTGKVIYMPDFVADAGVGYDEAFTREEVIALCEELKIVPVFKEESKTGRLPGEIWSQSVAAGSEISEGTKVTLKYMPNAKVKVIDLVGIDKDAVFTDWNKKLTIIFETYAQYVAGKENQIAEQSITKNTTVVMGSVITLKVYPAAP